MSKPSSLSLDVSQSTRLRPIVEIAGELGLAADFVESFGRHKAKIRLEALDGRSRRGNLVLVTAMTPTPGGEGKTTVTIGLVQALRRLGARAVAAIRQPSLGPVLGIKGGGGVGARVATLSRSARSVPPPAPVS